MTTQLRRTIWLTGASSGIGHSLAIQLANQNHKVLVSARSDDALQELACLYPNIIPVPFDVTDKQQIPTVRTELLKHTAQLDQIIINAGNCEYLDINHPDWSMMERIMSVNFFGMINTLDVAMPLLGRGSHIVGVVSLATLLPFPKAEAYGSSKAAAQYFLDSLRVDLRQHDIDVTVVNPGFVKTPLTDKNDFSMPFLMSSEQAAQRICKAIDKRPRQYDFPSRLYWLLSTIALFPKLWSNRLAPFLQASKPD